MARDANQRLTDSDLEALGKLADAASPAPWVASVEGRDHTSGDDVILVGEPREEDMYVSRDTTGASAADLDFISTARNLVPSLIDEVRRGRSGRLHALAEQGKRPYLAVYDYGTGGVWIYIYARSAEEIKAGYPGLTVITEWRDWMTPERVIELTATILPDMTFDIDAPDGWLANAEDELRRSAD